MAYSNYEAHFNYKMLATYQDQNQHGANAEYFKSGNAAVTGAWTFTPGSGIGITLTQTNNSVGFSLVNSGTDDGVIVNQNAVLGAGNYGLFVYSNQAQTNASLVYFQLDNSSSDKNTLLIGNDGQGSSIWVNNSHASGIGITISNGAGEGQGLQVLTDYVGVSAFIRNDGDNANRDGLTIQNGTDDNSGTNYHLIFADGDADIVGSITSSGGTVSYNPFTGSHIAKTINDDTYDYGTVLVITKVIPNILTKHYKQSGYKVKPCSILKDQKVFGIYSGIASKNRKNEVDINGKIIEDNTADTLHTIFCLGDGHILVCSKGGNISNGDYLTTSTIKGHAQKQDDDLLHNYTIAKVLEDVDWSKESGTKKLIACTYHAS